MPHYAPRLMQPISSHPGALPCPPHYPGVHPAGGRYISRGGMFEGPSLNVGREQCSYWSEPIRDVGMRSIGPFGLPIRNVLEAGKRLLAGFAPLSLGALGAVVQPAQPTPPPATAAHAAQYVRQTLRSNVPRGPRAVACPPAGGAGHPGMTPKGGVFDGSTLTAASEHWKGALPTYACSYQEPQQPVVPEALRPWHRLPNPAARARTVPVVRENLNPVGRPVAATARPLKPMFSHMRPKPLAHAARTPVGQPVVSRDIFGNAVRTGSGVPKVSTITPQAVTGFGAVNPDGIGSYYEFERGQVFGAYDAVEAKYY